MSFRAGRRTQRVASLIRAELSRLFIEEISDPRVKEVTVTEVEISGDLKIARVYFDSPALDDAKHLKEVLRGLERVVPFIRKKMAENLDLRHIPDLQFHRDTQSQDLSRLYKIMEDLHPPSKTGE